MEGGVTTLERVLREGLSKDVTFQLRHKGRKQAITRRTEKENEKKQERIICLQHSEQDRECSMVSWKKQSLWNPIDLAKNMDIILTVTGSQWKI